MHFETIASAVLLSKSFRAQLWHDSKFVSKQLSEIGPVLSRTLVEKGYDSFEKIMDENPRNIEFCLHRNPPFGSYLQEEVRNRCLCLLASFNKLFCVDKIVAKLRFEFDQS